MTKPHPRLMNQTAAAREEAYAWKAQEPAVHSDDPRVPAGPYPEAAAPPDGTSNGFVERANEDRDAVALERRRRAEEIGITERDEELIERGHSFVGAAP